MFYVRRKWILYFYLIEGSRGWFVLIYLITEALPTMTQETKFPLLQLGRWKFPVVSDEI